MDVENELGGRRETFVALLEGNNGGEDQQEQCGGDGDRQQGKEGLQDASRES